jgi:energy-coupling factor transport system permease protein
MEIKKSITIGQYIPANSSIHHLDSRMKLLSAILFMVFVFLIENVLGYLILLVFLLVLIFLSKIPMRYFINGLKPILMLIVFTVFLQLFFTKGNSEPFISIWIVKVYREGLMAGLFIFLRLLILVFSSSILTLTSSPMQLTTSLEFILKPFSYLGLPTSEISMMMTIALRFIPTILEETDRLIKAQSARGANFETGPVFKRINNLIPILIPLFVSSFRRADELAIAMESRCFQVGSRRTHLKVMKFKWFDYVSFIVFILFLGVISFKF